MSSMSLSEANDYKDLCFRSFVSLLCLFSCRLSCALTGPLPFVSPVLSSLFPSLSLSQPDYCRVYGPPR